MSSRTDKVEKPLPVTRRKFLGGLAAAAAAGILPVAKAHGFSWEEFFQKHFLEMSPEELRQVLKRLESEYREQFGRDDISVAATPPIPGVVFGYGLDLARCIGCRRCVYGCVDENNQSRDPQMHYIRVLRLKKGNLVRLEEADHHYDPELVPEEGVFYQPVQCQQCAKSPCTKVCPVKATWTEQDGIVVVDYNWCIGCRYCIAACPYRGRIFNWTTPGLPAEEVNPDTHFLGNRPRMRHVVEKCTFCIQRVRKGRYPACVEVCPVGARKFGNLLDPQSEMRYLIEEKRVFRLKEDLNTEPRFYYFFAT
jgi:molybdopterin-containing oxidoreductase family iron-sulfur binding subunit